MIDPETITTKEQFVAFVHSLRDDYLRHGSSWENAKLDSFLEAVSEYTSDLNGYYLNRGSNVDPDVASWRSFAIILAGATIYE